MNYGKHVNNKKTPQMQPILGRNDQVKNNAGGYVFKVSDTHLLERFILIGSEGGTYYVDEKELTVKNTKSIIDMIKSNGTHVLTTLAETIVRAPKKDAGIFVLALATAFGNQETKSTAYSMISDICRTSTQLFTFVQNIQELRGWSRGLRRGVAEFYTTKSAEKIAYQMVKYRQRNGWTHKDVIKLSHPKALNEEMNQLFNYAVTNKIIDVPLVVAFEQLKETTNKKKAVKLIKDNNLTWEMVPTELLTDATVLEALLENMPMHAMIRNLNRLTKAGLFDSNTNKATKLVVSRLTDKELLEKANMHPINILNSLKTYASGRGFRGDSTWTPNQRIVDALEEAFQLSFNFLKPTKKNILVAVDISGSMSAPVANMSLTAKEVAAALALSMVKTEPGVDLIWFDTQAYRPNVGARSSYEEVIKNTPNGGGTDCSLAYSYALNSKVKYDAIVILTDNETWAGQQHAVQLFDRYNKGVNPNTKHIVVGMAANSYSVLTDKEPNVLHIAGFDAAIPEFLNNFISGRL